MPGLDTSSLRIIHYPDPRLKKVCKPVEKFDAELAELAMRMIDLMHEDKGVGLAAPQVGVLLRLFVCNVTGEKGTELVVVNPELTDLEGDIVAEEGCLSIPEVTVDMRRAARCTLKAHGLNGEPFTLRGVELAARCWQHECDHLDGRLIIDHMSEADKIANRKSLKKLESEYKGR